MLILGIDPGYTNLGLAIIDTETSEILWSETVTAGVDSRPDLFGERMWPKLEDLGRVYDLDAVATETPPYLVKKKGDRRKGAMLVKTSALLSRVSGIIQAWAASRDLTYAEIAPLTLKRYCAKLCGQTYSRSSPPKKADIKAAVMEQFGKRAGDNHANDAALIAHYYGAKHGAAA